MSKKRDDETKFVKSPKIKTKYKRRKRREIYDDNDQDNNDNNINDDKSCANENNKSCNNEEKRVKSGHHDRLFKLAMLKFDSGNFIKN